MITVKDADMTDKAIDFIRYADADELAGIVEIMFGVRCTFNDEDESFEVEPTEDYCGAFDDFADKKP